MGAAQQLSAEDRLDIMDLYARYAWAMDSGDTEAFLDVFLPDATLYMSRSATGHAELRGWHERFLKDSGFPGSQHFATQFLFVEVNGNRVKTRVYVVRMYRLPGTTHSSVIWQGYYTDTCVKVDGRWYYELKNAHEASQLRQHEFGPTPYPVAEQPEPFGNDREGQQVLAYIEHITQQGRLNARYRWDGDEVAIDLDS